MSLKQQGFTDILTFARNSEKTYFGKEPDGFGGFKYPLKTAAVNEPAFDHDPVTGKSLGLSVHEQRTRLNTVSAEPTAAENITVAAVAHTVSFFGTGSIDLTGTHVQTMAGTGAFPARTEVTFTPTAGTLTITPTGDVQYLQLEKDSFATPIILGEGTQVTRQADVCSVDNIDQSDWWNPNAGTFVIEFERPYPGVSAIFTLSLGAIGASRIEFFVDSDYKIGLVAGLSSSARSQVIATKNKLALKIDSSNVHFSVNCGAIVSHSLGTFLDYTQNRLKIGMAVNNSVQLNGTVKFIKYKPTAVSDAELQELSKL